MINNYYNINIIIIMSNRTLNAFMDLFIQLYNAKMDMTPLFKLGKGLNKDSLYHNIIPHIIDMKNKEYTNIIFNNIFIFYFW